MKRTSLILAVFVLSSPARALDADLYAEILQRHTREVSDTAGVRVDYRALEGAVDWNRLMAIKSSSFHFCSIRSHYLGIRWKS